MSNDIVQKDKIVPTHAGLFSTLFSFFVDCVLLAKAAEFVEFEAVFEDFLIFARKIINHLALGALKSNHVVLGHTIKAEDC